MKECHMFSSLFLYALLTNTTVPQRIYSCECSECLSALVYEHVPKETEKIFSDCFLAEQMLFNMCVNQKTGPIDINVFEIGKSERLKTGRVFYVSAFNDDLEIKITVFARLKVCIVEICAMCEEICFDGFENLCNKLFGKPSDKEVIEVVNIAAQNSVVDDSLK